MSQPSAANRFRQSIFCCGSRRAIYYLGTEQRSDICVGCCGSRLLAARPENCCLSVDSICFGRRQGRLCLLRVAQVFESHHWLLSCELWKLVTGNYRSHTRFKTPVSERLFTDLSSEVQGFPFVHVCCSMWCRQKAEWENF